MNRNFIFLLMISTFFTAAVSFPQDSLFATKSDESLQKDFATIHIKSNIDGAKIFIDSIMIGATPIDSIRVKSGEHILWLVHPDGNNWMHQTIAETLFLHSGDVVMLNMQFPICYDLTSNPFGAKVTSQDSLIGLTPLRFSSLSDKKIITFSKDGYESNTIILPSNGGQVHVDLKPTGNVLKGNSYLSTKSSNDNIPLYISGGVAVVSGFTSAYLKIKADTYYDEYKRTGDRSVLNRVKRFDTGAGVSLVVCEISVIIVSYLLFSQ